jgi:hypothetical protein
MCILHISQDITDPYDRDSAGLTARRHATIREGKHMNLKTGATACGVAVGMAGALAFGAGAAHAAPYMQAPYLVVSNPNPFPGQTDGVQGFDYAALENVTLVGHSDPVTFGVFPTDSAGHFTTSIVIPEDWACSEHTLIGTGSTGDTASAVLHVRGCPNEHEGQHDHCSRCAGGGGPVFFGDDESDDEDYGPPGPGHALPRTGGQGGQVAGIALSGAALITAGLAITTRRRRRARTN